MAAADLQRFDWAVEICQEAFRRHPDDDNAVFGAAFYMRELGYPLEIVRGVVANAVTLNPSSNIYRVNYAIVCASLGDWAEAYRQACMLPERALSTLPCPCSRKLLAEAFQRFEDDDRLAALFGHRSNSTLEDSHEC